MLIDVYKFHMLTVRICKHFGRDISPLIAEVVRFSKEHGELSGGEGGGVR